MGVQVKILFIDDEISVIQPLAMEAEDQGFSAMISDTPEEAFQLLEEHHETIGLVFSDYRMGKTTGLEFRKKMMEKYKHIPFIIYSGFVNEEMLREAIDLKVSRFIIEEAAPLYSLPLAFLNPSSSPVSPFSRRFRTT